MWVAVNRDGVVLGQAMATWDLAKDTARRLAIATGGVVTIEEAYHGSYVPVEWCGNCTPEKNCQSLTAEEEFEMDYYSNR